MGALDDLFPETLSGAYRDVEEARALAWGLVIDWFGALSYTHNESTHQEILDSLNWPGMPELVAEASLHIQDWRIDFDEFADGVRAQAQRAQREGLVVEDGKPRSRKKAASGTRGGRGGDLFGEEEE